MKEYISPFYPPKDIKRAVALGNFDGVHLGHRRIISEASHYAEEHGISSCVYTFIKHPSLVFGKDFGLLTEASEKKGIFASLGADEVYFDDFSKVKDFSPIEFCKSVLRDILNAEAVFCGANFTYGKGGKGDVGLLRSDLEKLGIALFEVPYVTDEEGVISSTRIRKLLEDGRTEDAERIMGSPFTVTSEVIHGKMLGRKLGFPTVNQAYPADKLRLPRGVYAAVCEIEGKRYPGVTNVGTKPTVDTDGELSCETHVIGFDSDAYGLSVKTGFYKKLRDEKKFSSLEELTCAVMKNIEETRAYFSARKEDFDDIL